MKKRGQLAVAAAAVSALMMANRGFASPITAGDLLIYQTVGGTPTVGAGGVSGSSGLNSSTARVYLDEYTPTGTFVQAIAVNSTVPGTSGAGTQYALTATGLATDSSAQTEGQLSISPNGEYVAFTGYNAAVGTGGASAASAATINRTVGILTVGTGAVDTSTALTTAYNGKNISGAVTTNGTAIYTVGNSSGSPNTAGLYYTTLGSVGGETRIAPDKDYSVQVYNNQLYLTDSTVNINGIFSVPNSGGSLPTSSVSTSNYTVITQANDVNGFVGTTDPQGFSLLHLGTSGNNPDTAYMADYASGAIEKFTYSGPGSNPATNTPSLTLDGFAPLAGVIGLTTEEVTVDGATSVDIFATTSTGLYELIDSPTSGSDSVYGTALSGTPTLIASAPSDSQFRGIVADPAAVPEPASLSLLMLGGVSLLARRRRRA